MTATQQARPHSLARPHFQKLKAKRDQGLFEPVPLELDIPGLSLRRLSADTDSNEGNEDYQLELCEGWAATYGVQLIQDHCERGKPIYDQAQPWEGFQLAWDLIKAGKIKAVVASAADRFCRDPGEAIRFYDHCVNHRLRRVIFNGQLFDPMNPDHYKMLIDLATTGKRESQIKRTRALNKGTQKAKSGSTKQGGHRAFGFKAGGLELEPTEKDEAKAMVEAFIAGKALLSISEDLNARGILTTTGGQWTHTSVKQVISSWRLCGIRSHFDEPVAEGSWPAIVTREQTEAVRAVLMARVRPKGRPKQLLTGLLYCSCGCGYRHQGASKKRMSQGQVTREPGYMAAGRDSTGGHCNVSAALVEAETVALFLAAIRDGKWRELADLDHSAEREALLTEQQELQAIGISQVRLHSKGLLSDQELEAGAEGRSERSQAIQEALAALQVPALPASELQYAEERWQDLTQQERRTYLEALVARVELAPAGRGAQAWDRTRVQVIFKV